MAYFEEDSEVYEILGAIPLLTPVFPRYRQTLIERGRKDLAEV